jgi:cysteine-rich repeat protein
MVASVQRAVGIAVLACVQSCSLLFDARDAVKNFDGGTTPRSTIDTFEATPNSIRLGDTALLVWETRAAETSVQEDGNEIATGADGVVLIQPDRSTTYRIDADGEAREISVFVDEEVPPEILSFVVSPNVLSGGTDDIDASWRTSHGTVSLVIGDQVRDALASSGTSQVSVADTTDVSLFVFAAGSSAEHARVWSVEAFGPEDPRPIDGTAAVLLGPTATAQTLAWDLVEPLTVLPGVVNTDGDCVAADIAVSTTEGGPPIAQFESCEGRALSLGPGTAYFEVSLIERPPSPIFVPEWVEPECGNGVVEGSEACDDRDLFDDDGCNSDCVIEQGVFLRPGESTAGDPIVPPADATALTFETYADGESGWALVPAPFPISWFGRTYAGLIVHRNGLITFALDTTDRAQRIPKLAPDRSVDTDVVVPVAGPGLEPFDALAWSSEDEVTVDLTSSDARVQVRFFAEGEIEMRFGATGSKTANVTSGFQERTGTLGSNTFACNELCSLADIPAGTVVRFR